MGFQLIPISMHMTLNDNKILTLYIAISWARRIEVNEDPYCRRHKGSTGFVDFSDVLLLLLLLFFYFLFFLLTYYYYYYYLRQ